MEHGGRGAAGGRAARFRQPLLMLQSVQLHKAVPVGGRGGEQVRGVGGVGWRASAQGLGLCPREWREQKQHGSLVAAEGWCQQAALPAASRARTRSL